MFEYKINCSFNLGNVVGEVGTMLESMNHHLAEMGIHEKLGVRSNGISFALSCSREMKNEEKAMYRKLFLEQLKLKFPRYEFQIVSFRRKSRKSSSQSHNKS